MAGCSDLISTVAGYNMKKCIIAQADGENDIVLDIDMINLTIYF